MDMIMKETGWQKYLGCSARVKCVGPAEVYCPFHQKQAWLERKEEKVEKKGKWDRVKGAFGID